MSEKERELIADIVDELSILARRIDKYLASDELTTLWSQIGRLELLLQVPS